MLQAPLDFSSLLSLSSMACLRLQSFDSSQGDDHDEELQSETAESKYCTSVHGIAYDGSLTFCDCRTEQTCWCRPTSINCLRS